MGGKIWTVGLGENFGGAERKASQKRKSVETDAAGGAEAVAKMFKKQRPPPTHLTTDEAKAATEKKLDQAVDRLENRPAEPPRDDQLVDPEGQEPDLALAD